MKLVLVCVGKIVISCVFVERTKSQREVQFVSDIHTTQLDAWKLLVNKTWCWVM